MYDSKETARRALVLAGEIKTRRKARKNAIAAGTTALAFAAAAFLVWPDEPVQMISINDEPIPLASAAIERDCPDGCECEECLLENS